MTAGGHDKPGRSEEAGQQQTDTQVDPQDVLTQRWAASPENVRSRSVFFLGSLVGFTCGYGGVALFVLSPTRERGALPTTVSVLLVIAGIGLLVWSFTRRLAARAAFFERQQQAASASADEALDQIVDEQDLAGLLRFNRSQMRGYESLTREQAASSYLLSHVALGVGLVVVIGGSVAALAADGAATKGAAAGLAAIAAAVAGFIARTYLRLYERTLVQLNFYFNQPLVSSYVLTAERLAGKMGDQRRDDVFEQIVVAVLGNIGSAAGPSAANAPKASESDDPQS